MILIWTIVGKNKKSQVVDREGLYKIIGIIIGKGVNNTINTVFFPLLFVIDFLAKEIIMCSNWSDIISHWDGSFCSYLK